MKRLDVVLDGELFKPGIKALLYATADASKNCNVMYVAILKICERKKEINKKKINRSVTAELSRSGDSS